MSRRARWTKGPSFPQWSASVGRWSGSSARAWSLTRSFSCGVNGERCRVDKSSPRRANAALRDPAGGAKPRTTGVDVIDDVHPLRPPTGPHSLGAASRVVDRRARSVHRARAVALGARCPGSVTRRCPRCRSRRANHSMGGRSGPRGGLVGWHRRAVSRVSRSSSHRRHRGRPRADRRRDHRPPPRPTGRAQSVVLAARRRGGS